MTAPCRAAIARRPSIDIPLRIGTQRTGSGQRDRPAKQAVLGPLADQNRADGRPGTRQLDEPAMHPMAAANSGLASAWTTASGATA
jgi:hypothetical protein